MLSSATDVQGQVWPGKAKSAEQNLTVFVGYGDQCITKSGDGF
jgi:hypothetical protein